MDPSGRLGGYVNPSRHRHVADNLDAAFESQSADEQLTEYVLIAAANHTPAAGRPGETKHQFQHL